MIIRKRKKNNSIACSQKSCLIYTTILQLPIGLHQISTHLDWLLDCLPHPQTDISDGIHDGLHFIVCLHWYGPTNYKVTARFLVCCISWWRHEMETFSALLAICAGSSPVPGEFPTQRPVTQSFDVFFDLRPNKQLSKHWLGWWFEMPSCSLWSHCNVLCYSR